MLVFVNGDEVMLEKRPPVGIWGGLWSFPEVDGVPSESPLSKLTHTFTHFKLHITPQLVYMHKTIPQVNEAGKIWLPIDDAIGAAIPTPIRKILLQLKALKNQN